MSSRPTQFGKSRNQTRTTELAGSVAFERQQSQQFALWHRDDAIQHQAARPAFNEKSLSLSTQLSRLQQLLAHTSR